MGPDHTPDGRSDGYSTANTSAQILSLVSDRGNRRVLTDWIDAQDDYGLVAETSDVLTAEYDCLIVDVGALADRRQSLLERKEIETLVLPVILLVDETEERHVRRELRREQPALFDAINAVVTMPIAEYRFADQLRTLLLMREQSRKIAVQEHQLRAIRDEHAGHGVVITDPDGTIQYVNRAFEQQSGYPSEEVIGKNPRILQSGEHDESFYEELWDTILAGKVWDGVVTNERKSGETYILNQTIAPVTDTDGAIDRFIAVNHEITQLKELETSLRRRSEQLEILNRVLRHDIRNDLNVIIGWLEMVGDHVAPPGVAYIDRVTYSAKHMVEITEEASDLVQDITTDSDPDLEPVELSSVLLEEVEKRRETFTQATIDFRDEVPPGTTVRANSMLASVFRNLVNNAIQHNDSAEPRVEIRSTLRDASAVVTVADDGPGIPDGKRAQIFSQAEKGLESGGTGMGLFLVHSLVETYGGSVWIEDNDPQGAIFGVELVTTGSHPDDPE
ncbi:Signal transduction histidine kinase, contains PAS domain [Halanaeroarchaeum sp. HSR-CO]|uniref:PAS domain-containing sensor histidine kinase n=1 Tax=Halanaeroarchaeum sp. HSR-CO TaxID=2866382 RepID=UPI00217D18CA|nr:PAS domain-containing sensor histidine kinase [Halanaeroarchaeum sp. HSR-CO]UWG48991.1 Signal transduction histidine kinase, contains PAS domain [Halanaeroarchaeum sp. HSR-CO]